MWVVGTMKHLVWEMLRLNVPFVCFWGRKNVSLGRPGIDSLTVRYKHFTLFSNVWRLRLVSMIMTDPGCLER